MPVGMAQSMATIPTVWAPYVVLRKVQKKSSDPRIPADYSSHGGCVVAMLARSLVHGLLATLFGAENQHPYSGNTRPERLC